MVLIITGPAWLTCRVSRAPERLPKRQCRTVCPIGCVLNLGLQLVLVRKLTVVLASRSAILPALSTPTISLTRKWIIRSTLLRPNGRNTTALLTWPRNLGWTAPPNTFSILSPAPLTRVLCVRLAAAGASRLKSPCTKLSFKPSATTTTAPPKPIAWFPPLASCLLLSIRNRTPNMLGRVPLTLLKSIIEQGPWCMVLASRLFLLHFMHFGGVLTSWSMSNPLRHLDTLTWATNALLLKRHLVKVPVNLAPFILAALRKTKELTGCPGLRNLVWSWCMVLSMVWTVLLRLTISRRSLLLRRSSPLCLSRNTPSIGTLAYWSIMLVTLLVAIILPTTVLLFRALPNRPRTRSTLLLKVPSPLQCTLVIPLQLFLCLVCLVLNPSRLTRRPPRRTPPIKVSLVLYPFPQESLRLPSLVTLPPNRRSPGRLLLCPTVLCLTLNRPRWCLTLLSLLGMELCLTCNPVVVLLTRLTVPLGRKCLATQWPDNLMVVTTVLLRTCIPRRPLQCLPSLCRTETASTALGLPITMARNWCLSVPLPLKHPRHLLSAAVLTSCNLLCVKVGPKTPVVLTVFLFPLVFINARTLLTNRTTCFLSPAILPTMDPRCLLNLFPHPVLVMSVFTLNENNRPLPRPLGMLLCRTWRVNFLMTVAPLAFGLLTNTGPPPACWSRTRKIWCTLLLCLTMGLSPLSCVLLTRPPVHPSKVRQALLSPGEAIPLFPSNLRTVVDKLPLATLVLPRTPEIAAPMVKRVRNTGLTDMNLLLPPVVTLRVWANILPALWSKQGLFFRI